MNTKYLVMLIFLILISSVLASVTLRQEEVYEIGDKELIVESIRADKIKVNVDGVKNIINIGEEKEINGVDIIVSSIFYDDIPEERTVEVVMSMAFYCGDGNCDTGQNESKENCCEDCGCNLGYVCTDEICKSEAQIAKEEAEEEEESRNKCEKDIDCDDGDIFTEDICLSKAGEGNVCLNMPPICKTDLECDDLDPCTVDRCVSMDCINTKVPNYVACLKKEGVQEIEEVEETIPEEILAEENVIKEAVEKEVGFFSRIIIAFLNLFR